MDSVRLIKGNREWIIKPAEYGYTVSYGVTGGNTQSKPRPVKPKSNRTFEQQVELEINSRIKKQKDKGYHLPDEAPPDLLLPMLAHPYDPCRVHYPCQVQEKLNGVRCLATCGDTGNISLTTRKGKPITSMDHVIKELGRFMSPGDIWDGEIFSRQYNLQEISGAVRRSKAEGIAEHLEYWVYDMIPAEGQPFSEREVYLRAALYAPSIVIRVVQTMNCLTEAGIDLYYDSIVNQGGEGIMIRNPDASYQMDTRTYDLMKRKEFKDSEFTIVGFKRDIDGCVIWVCVIEPEEISPGELDAWLEFDVVPIGSKQDRKDLKPKEYLGKQLTVRYSDVSADGIPQGNPVGVCIRDYE